MTQKVKVNKNKTEELALQAAHWLNTVVEMLIELELKSDHAELEGLQSNIVEIHKCVALRVSACLI
jgi:hypothetical protein